MDINLQTKIATLLTAYPQLESTLLELSPLFTKLSNPLLRRTVAKVTSIQQAANIAGISPVDMMMRLRKDAGLNPLTISGIEVVDDPKVEPAWFKHNKVVLRYDATPMIEQGKSPMSEIIKLVEGLKDGDILELSAPFKPEPIMELLQSKGYKVWYNGIKCFFIR